MLANLRRKVGLASRSHTPQALGTQPATTPDGTLVAPSPFVENVPTDPTSLSPLAMEELGFVWPADSGIFSPSSIPVWLQEKVSAGYLQRSADNAQIDIPPILRV